jgi:hypothetical protein
MSVIQADLFVALSELEILKKSRAFTAGPFSRTTGIRPAATPMPRKIVLSRLY